MSDTLRLAVRRYAQVELPPIVAQAERRRRFPRRVMRQCARLGFLSLDPRQCAIVAQELPRCDSLGLALGVFVQLNLVAPLLDRLGTAEQKREWLTPLLRGTMIGAMAVTEPHAGSDYAALRTQATQKKDRIVLNGTKTYVTCANAAQLLIVAAREAGGLSLFLVPRDAPGARVTPLSMLGLYPSDPGRIELKNCRIPRTSRLGERGAGFGYIQQALNRERLLGGLACVAWAQHAMARTIAFARERVAFGRPLTRIAVIRHQFAEIATTLEAANQLNQAVFARWADGQEMTKEICMIKLFSYQAAHHTIDRCLQIHGGAGYLDESWIARFYRDARALTIAAGTPEIMKEVIAASMRL